MKLPLLIVLLSSLLLSCENNDNKKNINSIDDVATHLITGEVLALNMFLANPYQLEVVDSLLFIMDAVDDLQIAIYDIKNNRLVSRVIKAGQGPGEILLPITMDISLDNSCLNILQRQNGVYCEYNIVDLMNNTISPVNKLNFERADGVVEVDDAVLASGLYEKGMFSVWSKSGELLNTINTYPDYIQSIENPMDQYRLNQGYMAYNDEFKVVIFAGSFTGDITFYNFSDNDLTEFETYNFGNERLKKKIEGTGDISISREDIIHCYGINSTADYFYVLYSGETMANSQNATKSFVIKYDAKGELIDCYQTDMRLLSICVSKENNKLYGVALSEDLDYVIVQFNLY